MPEIRSPTAANGRGGRSLILSDFSQRLLQLGAARSCTRVPRRKLIDQRILLRTLTLHFVRVRGRFMFILCHAAKNEPRKRAKGSPWIPNCAQKRLHSNHVFAKCCKFRFCVGVLMVKRQHEGHTQQVKAKIFAVCYAPCVSRNFKQNETAKALAKLLPVQQPDGGYPAGDAREAPEGTSGLTFFGTFFVQRQRKYIKAGTAHARSCVRLATKT